MAAPWTAQVLNRAIQAHGCCVRAGELLDNVLAHLALPMHIADADGGRTRVRLVCDMHAKACSNLSFARSAAAAAELLAHRGGAANPTIPLPSIEHLPDGNYHVRLALGLLQSARILAEQACDCVERCRGRLCAAYTLLAHPGLPGVDGFVDAERVVAHGYLEAARDLAGVGAVLANTARSFLVR